MKLGTNENSCQSQPEIYQLNMVHGRLRDTVADISCAYQVQIASNISVCFFTTVCVLFVTISEYRANTDWKLWISGLLWVIYYIIRVIMICTSADTVVQKV